MRDERTIFDDLGVSELVNAAGTKTRFGGTRLRSEAADAMRSATDSFVCISDLQARASELISNLTHAEAGYVVTGASAALTVGTAACIAGTDFGVMSRLPDTTGVADEVVMARAHRTGYDHALRLAGATIVDVGTSDRNLGTASTNVKLWEYEDAIGTETAALAYIAKPTTQPPLEDVVEVAHKHDLPVIVDAAAELPPKTNLSRFIDIGADLVAFSGGKAIRGPQATGILAGRRALIRSVAFQQLDMDVVSGLWDPPSEFFDEPPDAVPRHGIGRGMKVGREELVGLVRALELFDEEDEGALRREWQNRATRMADHLREQPGVSVVVTGTDEPMEPASVALRMDEAVTGLGPESLARRLQDESPPIVVDYSGVESEGVVLKPVCLTDDEALYVTDRIKAVLDSA